MTLVARTMGWPSHKNETNQILVVCCMGWAPSVSNRQNFSRVRQTVTAKHETIKVLIVCCMLIGTPSVGATDQSFDARAH